jgi:glutamate carboxypeptidase
VSFLGFLAEHQEAMTGVPTLDGSGTVGDGAHALHEHVVLAAMAPRAALIASLLTSES